MSRTALLSLAVLVVAAAACRDDEPRPEPTAPSVSLVADDTSPDMSSTVCRAYARELAAARAVKDSGGTDPLLRQRTVALNAVIADACR